MTNDKNRGVLFLRGLVIVFRRNCPIFQMMLFPTKPGVKTRERGQRENANAISPRSPLGIDDPLGINVHARWSEAIHLILLKQAEWRSFIELRRPQARTVKHSLILSLESFPQAWSGTQSAESRVVRGSGAQPKLTSRFGTPVLVKDGSCSATFNS